MPATARAVQARPLQGGNTARTRRPRRGHTVEIRRVRCRTGTEGATILEVVLLIALAAGIAVLGVRTAGLALAQSRVNDLAQVGTRIQQGLESHRAQRGRVPSRSLDGRGLNLETLAPLTSDDLVESAETLLAKLAHGRVLAYDAPAAQEYWLLIGDRHQPQLQLLVARTDSYPASKGTWLEGLYLVRASGLERVGEDTSTSGRASRRDQDGREVPRV